MDSEKKKERDMHLYGLNRESMPPSVKYIHITSSDYGESHSWGVDGELFDDLFGDDPHPNQLHHSFWFPLFPMKTMGGQRGKINKRKFIFQTIRQAKNEQ